MISLSSESLFLDRGGFILPPMKLGSQSIPEAVIIGGIRLGAQSQSHLQRGPCPFLDRLQMTELEHEEL
jgi:hypothetical protein